MMMKRQTRWILGALMLTLSASACGGGQKAARQDEGVKPVVQRALIERHARWLPVDSVGVLAVDLRPVTTLLGQTIPAKDAAKAKAQHEALRQDMAALLSDRLGMNLLDAQYVVVGAGPVWQSLIVGGIGALHADVKTEQLEGFTVFRLDALRPQDHELFDWFDREDAQAGLWGVHLKAEQALVFFMSRRAMEVALRTPSLTLAQDKERAARFVKLLGDQPAYASAGVMLNNPLIVGALGRAEDLPLPLPDAIGASVGDQLVMSVYGPKDKLDAIDATIQRELDEAAAQVKVAYEQRATSNVIEGALAIQGYHSLLGMREAMKPARQDPERLIYQAQTPSLNNPALLLGIGASIALPSFLRVVKRSRTSMADSMIYHLTDRVASIYESSEPGQCAFPQATGPSGPVPQGGAKAANTFEGPAWEALELEPYYKESTHYFNYEVLLEGDRLIVRAQADFKSGGERHTIEMWLEQDQNVPMDQGCVLMRRPSITTYEYE